MSTSALVLKPQTKPSIFASFPFSTLSGTKLACVLLFRSIRTLPPRYAEKLFSLEEVTYEMDAVPPDYILVVGNSLEAVAALHKLSQKFPVAISTIDRNMSMRSICIGNDEPEISAATEAIKRNFPKDLLRIYTGKVVNL